MEKVIVVSASRGMKIVDCLFVEAPPDVLADVPDVTTPGVFRLADSFDNALAGHAGVSVSAAVLPGFHDGDTAYTLTVYGYRKVGSNWVPFPLYQADVDPSYEPTGDFGEGSSHEDTDDSAIAGLEDTDNLAATLSETEGAASGTTRTTSFGASIGPAYFEVDARGCPYLLFTTDQDGAFVAVAGL